MSDTPDVKPFIHIPHYIYNVLGIGADSMLCGLVAGLSSKYGYCNASNIYIAELFNTTEEAIKQRINKLVKEKYLENLGTRLDRKLKLIDLTLSDENHPKRDIDPSSDENHPTSDENHLEKLFSLTIYNKIIKDNKGQGFSLLGQGKKIGEKKSREIMFDIFWELFPKLVKKQESKELFRKLTLLDLEAIFEILPNVKAYHAQKSTETLFIPACMHPTTFLRNKRWEDETYQNTKKISQEGGETLEDELDPTLVSCLARLYSMGEGESPALLTNYDHEILHKLNWSVEQLIEEIGYDGYKGLKNAVLSVLDERAA